MKVPASVYRLLYRPFVMDTLSHLGFNWEFGRRLPGPYSPDREYRYSIRVWRPRRGDPGRIETQPAIKAGWPLPKNPDE